MYPVLKGSSNAGRQKMMNINWEKLRTWNRSSVHWKQVHVRWTRCCRDAVSPRCCAGCCSIDVWGIVLNILLQDAPFLGFRLLLIAHYRIISYMNVFFTCKNTLVIMLQLYRWPDSLTTRIWPFGHNCLYSGYSKSSSGPVQWSGRYLVVDRHCMHAGD